MDYANGQELCQANATLRDVPNGAAARRKAPFAH
jgi:hypothetical protein